MSTFDEGAHFPLYGHAQKEHCLGHAFFGRTVLQCALITMIQRLSITHTYGHLGLYIYMFTHICGLPITLAV